MSDNNNKPLFSNKTYEVYLDINEENNFAVVNKQFDTIEFRTPIYASAVEQAVIYDKFLEEYLSEGDDEEEPRVFN